MTSSCTKILLTGGAACGKSALGEVLLASSPQPRCYVATMQPYGAEAAAKIERHRRLRANAGFATIERYADLAGLDVARATRLAGALPPRPERPEGDLQKPSVLLECVCNLLSNEMFDESKPHRTLDDLFRAVVDGIEALASQCQVLIVVTNDVGADGVAYEGFTEDYVSLLGRVNCALAAGFDAVAEVCAGVPLWVKGGVQGAVGGGAYDGA